MLITGTNKAGGLGQAGKSTRQVGQQGRWAWWIDAPAYTANIFTLQVPFIPFNLSEIKEKFDTKGGSVTVLLTSCLTGLD